MSMYLFMYKGFIHTDTFMVIWQLLAITGGVRLAIFACMGRTTKTLLSDTAGRPRHTIFFYHDLDLNLRVEGLSD